MKKTKQQEEEIIEEKCNHRDLIPRWQCSKCKVIFRKQKYGYEELGKEEILFDNGEEEREKNCL